MHLPSIRTIEKAISKPTKDWIGNCYATVVDIISSGVLQIECKGCYGAYLGPIDDDSVFSGRGFSQHGWITTENDDIIDPTRWVFENKDPYLAYFTSLDGEYDDYDLAAIGLTRSLFGDNPPPPDNADDQVIGLEYRFDIGMEWVETVFGKSSPLNFGQVYWLAHRRPEELGKAAQAVLLAIFEIGQAALVPIDVRYDVFGMYDAKEILARFAS